MPVGHALGLRCYDAKLISLPSPVIVADEFTCLSLAFAFGFSRTFSVLYSGMV